MKKFMKDYLEGKLPEKQGIKVKKKMSEDSDEYDVYLELPLKKDEPVYVIRWGTERKAAALFIKEDFEKIMEIIEKFFYANSNNRAVRSFCRLFMASSFVTEYEEGMGFGFSPMILDKNVDEWGYIENIREGDVDKCIGREKDIQEKCTKEKAVKEKTVKEKAAKEKDIKEREEDTFKKIQYIRPYAFIAAKF